MSMLDLRTETVGSIPAYGVRAHVIAKQNVRASSITGGLPSGWTIRYLTIPERFLLLRAMIRVTTADSGNGTTTLTDGTITPLAAQVLNAIGLFIGTTNLPRYYASSAILSGAIATASITTAIFDVIIEGIDLRE